jgi:hypothetical protein
MAELSGIRVMKKLGIFGLRGLPLERLVRVGGAASRLSGELSSAIRAAVALCLFHYSFTTTHCVRACLL